MNYVSPQQPKIRLGSSMITGLIVLVLFVVFVVTLLWFRKPNVVEEARVDSIAQVLTPDPINEAVIAGAIDAQAKSASIHLVESTSDVGRAQRGEKDEAYFFEIKATLPEIDREMYYYNVWLVRPIPYDFLSLGEMVTDDIGDFVFEWPATDQDMDYSGYVEVIITRQEYEGSSDPNIKIAEGEFGE